MTHFVIPKTAAVSKRSFDRVIGVDISAFTGTGDYISFSLPEFPRTKLNLAATFVDFTSHPEGDFGTGPTDSIAFSQALPSLPTYAGDTEMRLPMSLLTTIDKSNVTGVRFRLAATEKCAFRCLAIRACAENWRYSSIDIDTLWHRAKRPPTPSGGKVLATNDLRNPSFGTNTTFVALNKIEWASGTLTREVKPNGITVGNGEYGAHVVATKDATTSSRTLSVAQSTAVGTLSAGLPYCLVIPIQVLNNIQAGFKVRLDWYNAASEYLTSSASSSTFTETGLATLGVEGQIAPVNTSFATAVLIGTSTTSGDTVDFWTDSWLVVQGTKAPAYFDGSMAKASWTGTPHASTSVLNSEFTEAESRAFPITFRSGVVNGVSDPEPVNLNVGATITTGSYGQATSSVPNEFAMFFRDIPTDNQTMTEMDSFTMSALDNIGHQPDFGKALYNSRVQEEVDLYSQASLDEKTQFGIERRPDESEHTWLEVKLRWWSGGGILTVFDADGVGYTFEGISLEASSQLELDKGRYALLVELEGSAITAAIYQLDQTGRFTSDTPVFTTNRIFDDNLIKRRKGRFGWWGNLKDGDAHIDGIKTRGINFGEVVTKEFHSITPVTGVSLYAGSTSDHDLIEGFERTDPDSVTLSLDPAASKGGKAVRIETQPLKPLQGIVTNPLLIDDPSNIRISFDIKFPINRGIGGVLTAYLLDEYSNVYPVNLSGFKKNIWTHVKVSLPETLFQTGRYRLFLVQTLPTVATSWWIENFTAKTYSVKWSARAQKPDPWDNESKLWQEAGFTLNSLNGGIVFPERGNGLQVRAQALRQDAVISDFKAIPQYATLGNFLFRDELGGSHTNLTPGSIAENSGGFGATWESLTGSLLNDGLPAKAQLSVHALTSTLVITGYGFALPEAATIDGIEVALLRRKKNVPTATDTNITLIKSGSGEVGANLAKEDPWPEVMSQVSYGGPTVKWGYPWTVTEINKSGFGIAILATGSGSGENYALEIESAMIKIYYH